MHATDALAHEALALLVDAGGSWTVGLSSTLPILASGVYTNVTAVTAITNATLSRSAAAWGTPTGRAVIPAADVSLGTASTDFVPAAWVLYDGGVARWSGQLTDVSVTSGAPVTLPAATIRLAFPTPF